MGKSKKSSWWEDNRPLILFLLASAVFLFAANDWFWPTPDEYFYASVARSITAGVRGETCLSCLNAEHTYLVPALSALYQWIFQVGEYDLIGSRAPIIFFSLGTIYLFWLIAGRVVGKKNERTWFLWLLLLIPGFFVYSVRFMLDIPLTFGLTLLIYLLIINARWIWISCSLILILSVKEYGFFLALPIIFGSNLFDSLSRAGKLTNKISSGVIKFLFTVIPAFVVIAILLSSSYLPYPRLLGTEMIEYTGPFYLIFSKMTLYFGNILSKIAQFIPPLRDVAQNAIGDNLKMIGSIGKINFSQLIPSAIFNSPVQPEQAGGFLRKLWLIYQYNFSEQDVMIFVLPLFFTGLLARLKKIIRGGYEFLFQRRTDFIMLSLVLVFMYVNWHEALNIQGFRLTVPAIAGIVYFAYFGLRELLLTNNNTARSIFTLFFIFFILLYYHFVSQLGTYGSVLAQQGFIGRLLYYKFWIFTSVFSGGFALIWFYSSFKSRQKHFLLIAYILLLFVLKMAPFYYDQKATSNYFGFDYGLPQAVPALKEIRDQHKNAVINLNPYVLIYYSGQIELDNVGVYPTLRKIKQHNPIYFYGSSNLNLGQKTDKLLDRGSNLSYLVYVNREFNPTPTASIYQDIISDPKKFKKIAESVKNDRVQWQIFRIVN